MTRPEQNVLAWILEMGEARLLQFIEELLANPRMAETIATTLQGALRTKGQVDRNVQAMLTMLGVPTKADYNKLLSKIEALQGSLVNLNIKIDRLVASRDMPRRRPPARSGVKRRAASPRTRRAAAEAAGRSPEPASEHRLGERDEPR